MPEGALLRPRAVADLGSVDGEGEVLLASLRVQWPEGVTPFALLVRGGVSRGKLNMVNI